MHLDILREEMANAIHTERMRNTAQIEMAGLPTGRAIDRAEAVASAFESFHAVAKRLGPMPKHSRILKATPPPSKR